MGKYAEIEKRLEVVKYKLLEYNRKLPFEDEMLREITEDVIEAHKLVKSLSNGNKTRNAKWQREIKKYEKLRKETNINENFSD